MLAIFLYLDRSEKQTIIASANTVTSEYEILVDVEDSVLYLIQNKEIVKIYKCSGGKWSTPSPIGTWTITRKDTWGEGFRWKVDGAKCALGAVWNTWHIKPRYSRVGKLTWLYKNE